MNLATTVPMPSGGAYPHPSSLVWHSERSKESDRGQDRLYVSIPILNNPAEIASSLR